MNEKRFNRRQFLRASGALGLFAALSADNSLCAEPTDTGNGPISDITHLPHEIRMHTDSGWMRMRVYTDRVIRVTYTPLKSFPSQKIPVVIQEPKPIHWNLRKTKEYLIISTGLVEAHVNRASGAISFFDKQGKPVLREAPSDGRACTPTSFKDVSTFQVSQKFLLQEGEAIYGLGQHQQGAMNCRGTTVHLQQMNMHVALPVMMSSLGYGILWNNPAITDVSVGGSFQSIPSSHLINTQNQPGGLTGEYYTGQNFEHMQTTRTDESINFNWNQPPAAGMSQDNFSVRWTGEILTGEAGEYGFQTTSDDGIRLWVDNKLLIDNWSVHPAALNTARISLEANRRYPIRVEYFQGGGFAVAEMQWSPPSKEHTLTWKSEVGEGIDYYFIYGPELDEAIAEYRWLTGEAPMFPKWAWGYWQCKEHYNSQEEILGVAAEYRSLHISIDNIIQDWYYWSPYPWGSHKFDPKRYPHPTQMIRELHDEHMHIIISVWAKFQAGSSNYRQLDEAGVLYPETGGDRYYDAFNPLGRRLYWEQMNKELFSRGVDGWWLDATEPELGGVWGEFRNIKTYAGYGEFVFNAYPLMTTMAVYKGQRSVTSKKRVFILTRSAYAGQQRNAAVTWSGDITGTWDVFAKQIPAGLNFSLSGIPYWNTDIGGFFGGNPQDPAYRELFVRWFQFGAFCPMFRVHGTNYPKEMWRFGPDAEKILIKYDRLRYRLMPYIYSVAWRVTSEGYSMMRGLVMDFREDPKVHSIADQFLFGPALLINPVTQSGALARSVYAPKGMTWTDFWTGKRYQGGRSIQAEAPLDTIPIFVRAGSILPLGPIDQYSTQTSCDPIELRIYMGADGSFTLYEDENDNYNYEHGAYATIPIHWNDKERVLIIGDRKGRFPGMLEKRTFRIVWVRPNHGVGNEFTETADMLAEYHGERIELRER
jgi:alpha-D-xyloside xylohydrolase